MPIKEQEYSGPTHVKLSPTRIRTALTCPRKYRYRYVDRLESRAISSTFAFGRAVHKAIEVAYAKQNTPLDAEGVADVFTRDFAGQDDIGISYKEKEGFDTLNEKGRALVICWHENFGHEIPGAKIHALENAMTVNLDLGLTVYGHPDIIEERDGRLYVGDHKTVASWGESNEVMLVRDTQLTAYAFLCRELLGRMPDALYVTVLKKTKTPEAFRCLTTRTEAEVEAFAGYARGIAELMRFYVKSNYYPKNYHRDCAWCGFNPLCWSIDGAADMFITRDKSEDR